MLQRQRPGWLGRNIPVMLLGMLAITTTTGIVAMLAGKADGSLKKVKFAAVGGNDFDEEKDKN